MLRRIDHLLCACPAVLVTVLALGLALLLAVLDAQTGVELSVSIFYLFPVGLAAWYGGRWPAAVLCVACAVAWPLIEHQAVAYTRDWIPYWNATVRLGFFSITAWLLLALKRHLLLTERLARFDHLTGLLNSRCFKESAHALLDLARRHGHPTALAYVDLDDFKRVNDTLGHSEGDRVLRDVAAALAQSVRLTDLAARLGGDEFALLLPETDAAGAERALRTVRERLEGLAAERGWPIGFSIGIAVFRGAPADPDAAIAEADRLMYLVKRDGKRNTMLAELGETG